MSWWRKRLSLAGSVLFRGDLIPKPEEFSFLEGKGVSIRSEPKNDDAFWGLELSHSEWGTARLFCARDTVLPPKEMFEFAFIPKADKDAAIAARSMVMLTMDSRHDHILRDRKLMLRFLRAVMGNDGVVVMDHVGHKVWTRDALDDDLAHDADLDVEGIFDVEAVHEDSGGECYWVHTHGLAEIGGFDIDVFDPSPDAVFNIRELCRAMAFHILEGSIGPSTAKFLLVYPKGFIRLVEMDYFLEHADLSLRERIATDIDEYHRKNHSVLCEPEGGFVSRLLGGKTLQPAKFLKELPENPMFGFSTPATELMGERARKTYPVLRSLREEFAQYPFLCLVKLGMRIDGGGETDREHLWFEVHELFDDSIDATCVNQPYNVPNLKEGDRCRHPVDLITDWTIITPAGMINPRSTEAVRILRANPEAMAKLLKAMEKGSDQ